MSPTWAWGQSVSIQVQVSTQDVFVGETFICQVVLQGAQAKAAPVFLKVSGLSVRYQGMQDASMTMSSNINGRISKRTTLKFVYQYQVTVERAGVGQLPPATVKLNGKAYKTRAVPLRVQLARETEDFKLRIQAAKRRLYVGEPVLLTVRWYLRKNVKSFDFKAPASKNYSLLAVPLSELSDQEKQRKKLLSAEILGHKVLAQQGAGTLDGKSYTVLRFEKVVIPRRAGLFSLGPLTVQLEAVVGQRKRDLFNNPFGSRDITKKYLIPSNLVNFEVLSLPPAPPTFTGLIGSCAVEATVSPSRVRVGDPMTLTLRVKSSAPVDRVVMPDLSKQKWASLFKISPVEATAKVSGLWKSQSWTIRAREASIKSIPAIEMTYFDSVKGRYLSAQSAAIPIVVESSPQVTVSDLDGDNGAVDTVKQALSVSTMGILHNYEDGFVLESHHFILSESFFSIWNLIALVPLLAFFGLLLSSWLGQQSCFASSSKAKQRVLLEALIQLQSIEQGGPLRGADKISRVLRHTIAAIFDEPTMAVSSRDAVSLLSAHSKELASELGDYLQLCDSVQFGGLPVAGVDVAIGQGFLRQLRELLK
jgi:hypothetical protein